MQDLPSQKDDVSRRRDAMEVYAWMKTNGASKGCTATKYRPLLTFSFHSITHFSIQGIRLITKNSRVNLAVCCTSFSPKCNVLRTVLSEEPPEAFVELLVGDPGRGGRGKRGRRAGTGMGGGGSFGRSRLSK